MRFASLSLAALASLLTLAPTGVVAGPAAYGLCQTGCNGVAVACYAAAGYTFGTVTAGAGIPAVIAGCNSALGTCSATCAALLLVPVP